MLLGIEPRSSAYEVQKPLDLAGLRGKFCVQVGFWQSFLYYSKVFMCIWISCHSLKFLRIPSKNEIFGGLYQDLGDFGRLMSACSAKSAFRWKSKKNLS